MRIRKLEADDRELYFALADEFYHSEAVIHPVPQKNIEATFEELMRSSPYIEAQLIEEDDQAAGFALWSKSYSQEAGGTVVWLEELYLRPKFRSHGLGGKYMEWMLANRPAEVKRFRLEIEEDNVKAKTLYLHSGFGMLDYRQMYIDFD